MIISSYHLLCPLLSLSRCSNNFIRNGCRSLSMSSSAVKSRNFIDTRKLSVAVCQVSVSADKLHNIDHVKEVISTACLSKVDVVVLPEIWNSPYATTSFPINAEILPSVGHLPNIIDSPSASMLCEQAKKFGVYIVGGSIPEKESVAITGIENIYNTCLVINPNGEIVGKHRKMHLFDINVPGKIAFKESDSLTAGDEACIVDTPWGFMGVGICYDIRFPELAMIMRTRGCRMLFYPGAFNMVTGPAHWELLQRARAVDNQLFVIACSPARISASESSSNPKAYVAWGHSSVVSPWGDIVACAATEEETIFAELDFEIVDTMRANIPCWMQKRNDVYEVIEKQKPKL